MTEAPQAAPSAAEEPPIRVVYSLTPEDFRAFQETVARGPAKRPMPMGIGRKVLLWLILVAVFSLILHFDPLNPPVLFQSLMSGLLLAMGILLVTFFVARWKARRFEPLPDGFTMGERTLTLETTGISSETGNYRAWHAWRGILRMERDKHRLFLFLDANAAIILPQRAFADPKEFHRACALAEAMTGKPTNT